MKIIKPLFLTLFLILIYSCEKDEDITLKQNTSTQQVLKERSEITNLLTDMQGDGKLNWRDLSDDQLWAAYQFANDITILGWDVNSNAGGEKNELLEFVKRSEGKLDNKEVLIEEFDEINVIVLKVTKRETLIGLKNKTEIADLFEIGYEALTQEEIELITTQKSVSNSTTPLSTTNLHGVNINYPSRYNYHGIVSAWKKGLTGKGIGITIIDSGVQQEDLIFGRHYPSNINGLNPPSLASKSYGLHGKFRWCGACWWEGFDGPYKAEFPNTNHGTDMIKVAAAPMGNSNRGKYTGVAYAANARSYRAAFSVWIGSYNALTATTKSYNEIANRSDVKIVSMSMGRLLWSEMLARSIRRCTNAGKLVFNAAGTLPGFLNNITNNNITLFPARMGETVAVTGVNESGNDWCSDCHGRADFVIQFADNDPDRSSSFSTSTTAGIAALIWADNPSRSASNVIQVMRNISEYGNNRHPWKGHGRIYLDRYNTSNTPATRLVHFRKYNSSGFALDGNWNGSNGQNVYLWNSDYNNVNQQWIEIDRGNGYFSYQKKGTNMCLDGSNGGANGNNVKLWQCNSQNSNQQWLKIPTNGGRSYMFRKRNASNFAIDGNAGANNATNVHMWSASLHNSNQQWILTDL